jgi:hypothetical protein
MPGTGLGDRSVGACSDTSVDAGAVAMQVIGASLSLVMCETSMVMQLVVMVGVHRSWA